MLAGSNGTGGFRFRAEGSGFYQKCCVRHWRLGIVLECFGRGLRGCRMSVLKKVWE